MDKTMVGPPSLADMNFLQWGSRRRMRCIKVQVRPDPITQGEKKSPIRADRHLVRAEKETAALHFEEEEHHSHNKLKSKEAMLITSEHRLRHNQVKVKSKESIVIPSEHQLRPKRLKINSGFKSTDLKLSIPCKDNTNNNKRNFGFSSEKSSRVHALSNGVCTRSNNIDETNKISADGKAMQDKLADPKTFVWPKFLHTLSHSEKVEDFRAMKNAKLPLRPRKRSKLVQKAINAITPGLWLSDLSPDHYQVREKKSMKKMSKGLKAMQSVDSGME